MLFYCSSNEKNRLVRRSSQSKSAAVLPPRDPKKSEKERKNLFAKKPVTPRCQSQQRQRWWKKNKPRPTLPFFTYTAVPFFLQKSAHDEHFFRTKNARKIIPFLIAFCCFFDLPEPPNPPEVAKHLPARDELHHHVQVWVVLFGVAPHEKKRN